MKLVTGLNEDLHVHVGNAASPGVAEDVAFLSDVDIDG